jgi:hypothetical protein
MVAPGHGLIVPGDGAVDLGRLVDGHDQQVPARPEAAPDLGDEGRGMREVL